MALYLGIDGGGTGCRAAVADARGMILGRGEAGPANVNTDTEGSLRNILAATTDALEGLNVTATDLQAVLGLAGANVSAAAEKLSALLPFARTEIVSDAVTAARGALGGRDGVVAAIGTGSVFAVQRAGEIRQVGGRGFVLGDEGSGSVLGRALLRDALRADDRMIAMTPLLAEVLAEFGRPDAIITWGFRAGPAEFATFAPRVIGSDDPAALAIFAAAAQEVSAIIATLQPENDPLPVVFIGGLGNAYAKHLQTSWQTLAPAGSGLDGAVQLALQRGGAI